MNEPSTTKLNSLELVNIEVVNAGGGVVGLRTAHQLTGTETGADHGAYQLLTVADDGYTDENDEPAKWSLGNYCEHYDDHGGSGSEFLSDDGVRARWGRLQTACIDCNKKRVVILATRFDQVLRVWLSAEDYSSAVRLNNELPEGDPCCYTHNYCDANMAMAEAFRATVGRESECGCEHDSRLWDEAWGYWKRTQREA